MLNTIALESPGTAVVHVHWQRDGNGALRIHQPVAIVFIDVEIVGDDLKLITGHSKHVVVVNVHERQQELRTFRRKTQKSYLPRNSGSSNKFPFVGRWTALVNLRLRF